MLNLKIRTEYSFRNAFGPIETVISACSGDAVGVTDSGTWGHVKFAAKCAEAGKKPIFGVEISVVEDASERTRQPSNAMCFLAKNNSGLKEIYLLVTKSTSAENFYYFPRLSYSDLFDVSENIFIFSGTNPNWGMIPLSRKDDLYIELNPMSSRKALEFATAKGFKTVATSDNYYPRVTDKKAYEVLVGRNRTDRTSPMHILDEWSWREAVPWGTEEAVNNTYEIAAACDVDLPTAKMVKFKTGKTLKELCLDGAKRRGITLDADYSVRLKRELETISSKKFEDYFFVIADMIDWAKERMLVGPGRGSSAGSLVCYLTGITDVDPIKHGLMFERFVDATRDDLPDIDIDFQDDRREMVFEYLRKKYGPEKVAHLGTVSRYKAKSVISEVGKELSIPPWELQDLKAGIIERSPGDERANKCIMDTFSTLEVGKVAVGKYPAIKVASEMEGHARHCGTHAAGILVTDSPVSEFCSVSGQTGAAQIDKIDAEKLNLLKIDALGLRTLTILQDTLDQVGWTRQDLLNCPTQDESAFRILNDGKFAGVFQFEGQALQSVARQIKVSDFEDLSAITSLARPGPLMSGGTSQYIKRRTGQEEVAAVHPVFDRITKVTFGIVIYQEQVMEICREIGQLTWTEINQLRRAMGKSLGQQKFDQFFENFKKGAEKNGTLEKKATEIWQHVHSMGTYAFNRSHAVSYSFLSFWCCIAKSRFPLEFAAASLRHAKDEGQGKRLLREVVKEGLEFIPFDRDKSDVNWTVQDGKLIGGLTGIKGIGNRVAQDILERRKLRQPLTPRQDTLLSLGKTPYNDIFECERKFGHIKSDPAAHKIVSKISDIDEITEENYGSFVFFGKVKDREVKDLNERPGTRKVSGASLSLNLTLEDDTSQIICTIDRFKYPRLGLPIVADGKIGDWLLIKGNSRKGFRRIYVEKYRNMD
tara:strand:+ start:6902 stop:9697 length:2796 start_codon:yes stop_codon:yes gene_type:complete